MSQAMYPNEIQSVNLRVCSAFACEICSPIWITGSLSSNLNLETLPTLECTMLKALTTKKVVCEIEFLPAADHVKTKGCSCYSSLHSYNTDTESGIGWSRWCSSTH